MTFPKVQKMLRRWRFKLFPREYRSAIVERIYVPVYGQWLHVLVQNDYRAAWLDLFPDAPCVPHPQASGSSCFDMATGRGYIALRLDATAGTIAHEAAHYTHKLLDYVGVKHDRHNDEAECYMLGWVVEQLTSIRDSQPGTYSPLP